MVRSTQKLILTLALGGLCVPLPCSAAKATFEELLASLKSPTAKTRQDAAEELGNARRRDAVVPLSALVRDPEPKVRLQVARALGQLRDLSAVPALVTALQDGDVRVREEAIGSLVELYSERESDSPVDRFLRVFSDENSRGSVQPFTAVDPAVHQGLARALRDEEPRIREEAALALGILDGHGSHAALVGTLQDPEPSVRAAAATAIGKVGRSPAEGRPLIALLSDESNDVRSRVETALAVLKVREAGPALREIYETNRRRETGTKALECLSRIADPSQVDFFRGLLEEPDMERRRLAVEGLGRIADASMLPAFKKDFQRERGEELRLAYSFSLALLGDRAFVDTLVLALPSRLLGPRIRDYLLELGPQVAPDLYPYLNDPNASIRAALCDVLGQIGDPGAIPRLTPLLNDPNSAVADRANLAVERLRRTRGGVGS